MNDLKKLAGYVEVRRPGTVEKMFKNRATSFSNVYTPWYDKKCHNLGQTRSFLIVPIGQIVKLTKNNSKIVF